MLSFILSLVGYVLIGVVFYLVVWNVITKGEFKHRFHNLVHTVSSGLTVGMSFMIIYDLQVMKPGILSVCNSNGLGTGLPNQLIDGVSILLVMVIIVTITNLKDAIASCRRSIAGISILRDAMSAYESFHDELKENNQESEENDISPEKEGKENGDEKE